MTARTHSLSLLSTALLSLFSTACVGEDELTTDDLSDAESIETESIDSQEIAAPEHTEHSTPVSLQNATLVGRWTLDGNINDAVGINHGAAFGNTSYVAGVGNQGQALRINAQGGGASVDSIVDYFGTGDFSVAVWVNYHGDFAGHARHEHIFLDGGAGGQLNLFAERNGSGYYWWVGSQVAVPGAAPWISAQDQWHHVVMGRQGNQRFLCFDGQLAGQSSSAPADLSGDNPFYLGRNPYQNGGRSLPAALDELRAYDGWIGADGCAALYTDPHGICGDGVETGAEACDDGNQDENDGCLSTCELQPEPPLLGHWTFETGVELEDLTGKWGDLTLQGATISGGELHVHASGATGWAVASGSTTATIREKTLVSWVSIDDLDVRSGSALTIDSINNTNYFDAIVYAERQPLRWMAGSDYFKRTQDVVLQNETAEGQVVQMAIAYRDLGGNNVEITICRDGVQIGKYNSGFMREWQGNNAEILFGARHTNGNTRYGALEARIAEARIYDEAMTCGHVGTLEM